MAKTWGLILDNDTIDRVAGIASDTALYSARRFRPEFVEGAERCRRAVLEPASDVGLGRELRAALAARMARMNASHALAAHYREKLAALGLNSDLEGIAHGGYPPSADRRLRAILRHVDLITLVPRACTQADTEGLVAQGLSVPEVVAMSELIGFLNFEVRIVATLGMLKETE